ncbi:MAG: hypothetical protein U0230_05415 [Polyangiales bacterium]
MTEDKKKGPDPLDFSDLDDALADWERDVEGGAAIRPESAPMPQTAKIDVPERVATPIPRPSPQLASPEHRSLYRPPSADELKKMEAARTSRGLDDFSIDFDDDGDDGATRIAAIPTELIEQLQRAKAEPAKAAPPPAPRPEPPATVPPGPSQQAEILASIDVEADFGELGLSPSGSAPRPEVAAPVAPAARPAAAREPAPLIEDFDLDDFLSEPPKASAFLAPPMAQHAEAAPPTPPDPGLTPALGTKTHDTPTLETPLGAQESAEVSLLSPGPDDEPELETSVDDEPVLEAAEEEDDEPVLEAGEEEDEGPVLSAGDEEEPELETSVDDEPVLEAGDDEPELDFGEEPVTAVDLDATSRAARMAPPSEAAGRAEQVAGWQFRKEMLLAHVAHANGPAKAELLVAAAALAERAGDETASDLYDEAHSVDPKNVGAIRAARRLALAKGDVSKAASLVSAELALPVSPEEKGLLLALAAELELHGLRDAGAAEKSARLAVTARRVSPVPSMLLSEALSGLGKSLEASMALEKAAEALHDGRVKAALLADLALAEERAGHAKRARELYERAAHASDRVVAALVGAIRAERRDPNPQPTIARLEQLEASFASPRIAAELRRARASLLQHGLGRATEASQLLAGATDPISLAARADAARAGGDRADEGAATAAWAAGTTGTERALALVRLAELRVAADDHAGADECLREAALADPKLGLVRVVREVLARRAGDASRLASATLAEADSTSEGALAAAARVAHAGGALAEERGLLDQAVAEGEAMAADVVGMDVAAATDDLEATEKALRRVVERVEGPARVSALLALAFLSARRGKPSEAAQSLSRAREVGGDEPVVAGPLSRRLFASEPESAAKILAGMADATSGELAAFAATEAARAAIRAGLDPVAYLRRALEADPSYAPPAWMLERRPELGADPELRREVNERLAAIAEDPSARAAAVVASLAHEEAELPALQQWRSMLPDDPIVLERLASHPEAAAQTRADALTALAGLAGPTTRSGLRVTAAALRAASGDPAEAATMLREELAERPDDAFAARGLLRAELTAGEIARTAERLFHRVRSASDEPSRARSLLALADLDLHERGDETGAMLTLAGVREIAAAHLPTLRALERHAMDRDATADLLDLESALADAVKSDPDASAHARMAVRLRLASVPDVAGAADPLLRAALDRGTRSRRLLQMIEGMGVATRDRVATLEAERRLYETTTDPHERVALALRMAESLDVLEGPGPAARLLKEAADLAPDHPTAHEALGVYLERAGDAHSAASAFERAAANARVRGRAASLHHRAGVLWQDGARDLDRALACYEKVAAIDVAYLDAFERAEAILKKRDNPSGLVALYDARIAAGGDATLVASLHARRAGLAEQLGDRTDARDALRRALELTPDDVDSLKRYAELSMQDDDHRSAAEALIRIARVRQDREELRWVFMSLGDIYDLHMPDARRAEAAFRRVLKLVPQDKEALERLVRLHIRHAQMNEAVEAYQELSAVAAGEPRLRPLRLLLADGFEKSSDARKAESVLEQLRREKPTDTEIVVTLAEFYKRQNAQSALSMHLNRAVADYRKGIDDKPTELALWHGLVQIMDLRGRNDAARATASAAFALGIVDTELARHLDAQGNVPGAGKGAASPELDELLAPRHLSPAALQVFKLASEVFERTLPFDAKQWRAEKLPKEHPIRQEANRLGQWFGLSDVQVLVTGAAPRICVPVSDAPVTIVVGRDLPTLLKEGERTFLLFRALKVASAGLSVALRMQPGLLSLALHGLVKCFDPSHSADGLDAAQLDDMSRRLARNLGRKAKSELGALALEMSGRQGFDAQRLGLAAAELGDRAAVLATGSPILAITSLLELAGKPIPGNASPAQRCSLVRGMPEAWSLIQFAISDAYFDARHRAGADRL